MGNYCINLGYFYVVSLLYHSVSLGMFTVYLLCFCWSDKTPEYLAFEVVVHFYSVICFCWSDKTPEYSAPEVVRQLPDPTFRDRLDLWSIACCVMFLLSGRHPWSDVSEGGNEELRLTLVRLKMTLVRLKMTLVRLRITLISKVQMNWSGQWPWYGFKWPW